jgi:hypothetical protein
MKKKNKHSLTGKIIIGTVALLFLLYALFLCTLCLAGTKTQAKITDFRRELAERNETIRNQYTYAYGYEFIVSGKQYSGHSKKVQGPVFLKNQGSSYITVYYLECCPVLNYPGDDFKPWYKILIYFAVAGLLGYFMINIK